VGGRFWEFALGACARVLIVGGQLPFLSPAAWRAVFQRALQFSDGQIRFLGLLSLLAGLVLLVFFAS
jgi:uncharacterized protein YjeT (DUF2065 family)